MNSKFFLLLFCFSINGWSEIYEPRELYIDLLKKVVSNTIYEDRCFAGEYDPKAREMGEDHPTVAHTMLGMQRLNNIHFCLEQIIKDEVPGDCIETGVWRGGATILMRGILKAFGDSTRKVWVADSFEGLPLPNVEKYLLDQGLDLHKVGYLSVSLEQVKENFRKYDLLDDQVIFLNGFFCDTLPTAPIESLSLLRLDGDLYESTMDALVNLYPKLSVGGYLIVDDYGAIAACSQAVHDYRDLHAITDEIIWIDPLSVYWKKSK